MNIVIIEERLGEITDAKLLVITELIVNAVRDYPMIGLNDTDDYLKEVKKKLLMNKITSKALTEHINKNLNRKDEINIWIASSFNSLADALDLMELYKIPYDAFLSKLQKLVE